MLENGLYLSPRVRLSPNIFQALQILQMSAEELSEMIQTQAMENPIISLNVSNSVSSSSNLVSAPISPLSSHRDNTLQTTLRLQIPLSASPEIQKILLLLIDSLDTSGYLREPPRELAKEWGIPFPLVSEALDILHSFDPPGIGASSLSECLLLQIERQEPHPLVRKIIQNYLDDVAAGRFSKIAKNEHVSLEQVEKAAHYLRSLSPRPASGYDTANTARYVIPDILVTRQNNRLEVTLNEQIAPKLTADPLYVDMISSISEKETRLYLQKQMTAFNQLEQSIAMRTHTLLAVTKEIVSAQSHFFLTGDLALQPLSMENVSQKIDMHISTVSRAVRNKYLLCEWGLFPLRHFFARAIPSEGRGNSFQISNTQIQCMIQGFIQSESRSAPLSDQQIVHLLSQSGIIISRRAVAKYRQILGIPSTYVRRQSF